MNILDNILLSADQHDDDLNWQEILDTYPLKGRGKVSKKVYPTHVKGVYKIWHEGEWYLRDERGHEFQCKGEPDRESVELFELTNWGL